MDKIYSSSDLSKVWFVDLETGKRFEAQRIELKSGEKAYLAPLWVKSGPTSWKQAN